MNIPSEYLTSVTENYRLPVPVVVISKSGRCRYTSNSIQIKRPSEGPAECFLVMPVQELRRDDSEPFVGVGSVGGFVEFDPDTLVSI